MANTFSGFRHAGNVLSACNSFPAGSLPAGGIGCIPPAEAEANYSRQLASETVGALSTLTNWPP
ncbi:hypothetical protein D7S55_26705 [Ralstonia pickettii]|nr:hypothetical protein [Ralstonia pickettii]MBA9853969.1 hypothetical protein [Ralstonia pickettii]MBA9921601.1 hypothetical protein [Ralstonia pickettii]MBA9960628.1 hypothetical protein [Ralstonia pickettii]MBA9966120.1 hypothetical protein [Ralstonia pickettii]